MAFCTYSKDNDTAYTVVENKFLTKYLPEADGLAVKVYLYGLYLCSLPASDFSLASMAEVLKVTEEEIKDAFAVWQEYDLVEILSQEPFTVQYLTVQSAIGKPKKIHYEKYAQFNKELQRKLQKIGKYVTASDYVKYMRFLEENAMQPQAFLLVTEYCINKQGESLSPSYVFNKAKKLLKNGYSTYEQVERALSSYNVHEGDLIAVYNAMSVYQRTPDDNDYALYDKWREKLGFGKDGVLAAARKLPRGSMTSLDLTLETLAEKGKLDAKEIDAYLTERTALVSLAFRIGRKLGVKIQNPAPFVDEYVEKWYNYGFEETSLLDLALFCLKTERNSFEGLGELIAELFKTGVVSPDGVKGYLKERNEELKLFSKIQDVCGGIRRNSANVALIATWREWNFSNEMILEAAKRSAASANPVPYMNKILSEWKQTDVFTVEKIPAATPTVGAGTRSNGKTGAGNVYINPSVEAANAKSARERYYSILREKAQSRVDKAMKKANGNGRFKEITAELSKMEIALAKAEVFEPSQLPALQEKRAALFAERKALLQAIGVSEEELIPKYECERCMDTGFLPNGVGCSCYGKQREQA